MAADIRPVPGIRRCHDGTALVGKHDVVLVTLTHRLNAFGYLYLAGYLGLGDRFAECQQRRHARRIGRRARVGARQYRPGSAASPGT